MVFSSLVFLWLFLPVVLGLYFLAQEKYRNVWLLIASLFFYAWGEPVYVFVMIFSILANYICGLKIADKDGNKNKTALVTGIVINLLLLGVFKYSGFVIFIAFLPKKEAAKKVCHWETAPSPARSVPTLPPPLMLSLRQGKTGT